MLAHGVSWLVPRLRRSLPRREKRGSEASRRECGARSPHQASSCAKSRKDVVVAGTPKSGGNAADANTAAFRHAHAARQAFSHHPRLGNAPAALPQRGASERRHNTENPGRKPGDKPRPKSEPRRGGTIRRRHPARAGCLCRPPTPAPATCAKKKRSRRIYPQERFFQEAFALRLICGGGARRRARARPSPRADRTPTVPESRRH